MIYEDSFCFDELEIDYEMLARELGYSLNELPDPFPEYLKNAQTFAGKLSDFTACYQIVNSNRLSLSKALMRIDENEFKIGRTIAGELKNSSAIVFFICSAGKTISEEADRQLKSDDPVYGYVLNILGSAITEAIGDKIQHRIKIQASGNQLKITNRYSPGYCHWNVADQHKLFALFGEKTGGVRLTESALMQPVKSISGVIGMGAEVEFHDYQCKLCDLPNCFYRGIHHH